MLLQQSAVLTSGRPVDARVRAATYRSASARGEFDAAIGLTGNVRIVRNHENGVPELCSSRKICSTMASLTSSRLPVVRR